jgi:hypothetical protein
LVGGEESESVEVFSVQPTKLKSEPLQPIFVVNLSAQTEKRRPGSQFCCLSPSYAFPSPPVLDIVLNERFLYRICRLQNIPKAPSDTLKISFLLSQLFNHYLSGKQAILDGVLRCFAFSCN